MQIKEAKGGPNKVFVRKKELENNFGLEIGLKWEKGGGQTCSRNAMQYGNKNWNFKKEKKRDFKYGPE